MLMDVTTEDIAHKGKRADFVGFKRYIDRLARLNAFGDIYPESLQTESVSDIRTAQPDHHLIAFGYLDHRGFIAGPFFCQREMISLA